MRFLMLMYPGKGAEAGRMPDEKIMTAMMKYNEDLTKAGVLLSLDGLHPSSKGARVIFQGGKPKVTDGPFTEAKEIIGGYWMIQVKSKAEAIEWASRIPATDGEMVELRQVFEMSDFNIDSRSELNAAAERVSAAIDPRKQAWPAPGPGPADEPGLLG